MLLFLLLLQLEQRPENLKGNFFIFAEAQFFIHNRNNKFQK